MTGPVTRITAPGSRSGAFGIVDWGLLAAVALIWGSSFLLIAAGLDSFSPGVVSLVRLLFGAATLALYPGARTSVAREDWPRVALLGVTWMGIPLILFPIAQQWIDSSLAGMLNAALPLMSATIAAFLLRKLPGLVHVAGLFIGFAGVGAITLPAVRESHSTALGTLLVLVAVLLYSFAVNVAVPLQQRYGSAPVLLRAQLVAFALILPVGLIDLPDSGFSLVSLGAVAVLGIFGTGLAFLAMTALVGRVGATRGSVAIYFLPVVAIVLGVAVRGEQVHPGSLLGTALVLAGAYLASRPEAGAAPALEES